MKKSVKKYSWDERMAKKEEKKRLIDKVQKLKSEKSNRKEYHRIRTQENKKKKLENQKKSEIVQTVSIEV